MGTCLWVTLDSNWQHSAHVTNVPHAIAHSKQAPHHVFHPLIALVRLYVHKVRDRAKRVLKKYENRFKFRPRRGASRRVLEEAHLPEALPLSEIAQLRFLMVDEHPAREDDEPVALSFAFLEDGFSALVCLGVAQAEEIENPNIG